MRDSYARFDRRVTTPAVWHDEVIRKEDIANFRGDTQYIWQAAHLNLNEVAFALTYFYLKSSRCADLLTQLQEDGAFAAVCLEVDGRLVSRDLLDSVTEIDFLRRHAGLGETELTLLDIGAGYGRLAYHIASTWPDKARVFTTDAFAVSTFLSEFYLSFRRTAATVVPLDAVDAVLPGVNVDVATNIHSFPECTVEAIDWWVERLASWQIRYLMIAPNGERCVTNKGEDMVPIFARHGYRLKVRERRFSEEIIHQFGVDPCCFYLFERE